MNASETWGRTLMCLLATLAAWGTGCVERKLLIRSEPSGAPVWVDERYAGRTPVDHEFSHYGHRRVRVGPIRDQKDAVAFASEERLVEVSAPWYEKFPVDFFSEVLWPWTLTDEHPVSFRLLPPSEEYGKEEAREVLKRAEEFRRKALSPVPERTE